MLTLSIDTSGRTISTALLRDDQLLIELNSSNAPPVNPSKITSQAGSDDRLPAGYTQKRSKRGSKTSRIFPPGASTLLAPMLKSLVNQAGVRFEQVDLIALTTGPGLFTGLRVAVVTAKALAYSTGADLIGVNTLEVIAAQTADHMANTEHALKNICPVLNAQRQKLFSASFESLSDWQVNPNQPSEILEHNDWLDQLPAGSIVTGMGLKPIEERVSANPEIVVAPKSCWDCSPVSVAKFALKQYQAGRRDDFWKLEPVYFRPSSAEERRDEKLNRN